MKLALVSENSELVKLCRELLGELPDKGWEITTASEPQGLPHDSDVYLWDFHSGLELPALDPTLCQNHCFLVSGCDLAEFREKYQADFANILLKPVTPVVLRAFLAQVIDSPADMNSGTKALRAERDELLRCLFEANLRLQEYDHERTNFLARAVHDFRTPLTAVTGYCSLLLSGNAGPLNARQMEIVRRMEHSSKRLGRMANAMFQLSINRRLVEQPLNLQRADIQAIVDQALHEVWPLCEEKGISVISAGMLPPPVPLYMEASQIEQVMLNLLDNACKFTPKFGCIEIEGYPYFWDRRLGVKTEHGVDRRKRSHHAPNAYRVDIRDSGPGVAPEYIDKIFEEFTSFSGPHDRSGGGLGLAICRLILHRHHGRIWAESGSEGTRFSFVLPLRQQSQTCAANCSGGQEAAVGLIER